MTVESVYNYDELLKESELNFKSDINRVIYHIFKDMGDNIRPVTVRGLEKQSIDVQITLARYGIFTEDSNKDSGALITKKLLIIPKEFADNCDNYIRVHIADPKSYTAVVVEKDYATPEEYITDLKNIKELTNDNIVDLVDRSNLKSTTARLDEIKDYYLAMSGVESIIFMRTLENGRENIPLISDLVTNKPKSTAIALDISDLAWKLFLTIKNSNNVCVTYKSIYLSVCDRVTRLRKQLASKGTNPPIYLTSYKLDIEDKYDTEFDTVSCLLLSQYTYSNAGNGIFALLTPKQLQYHLTNIGELLYNPRTMFIEDRLAYLTNYPELSFMERGDSGVYQVVAYNSSVRLDLSFIKEPIDWKLCDKQESNNRKLDLSEIDVLSVKQDFLGGITSEISDTYNTILSVLESSISNVYLKTALDIIKFRFIEPEDPKDIDPNIDYNAVHYGIVNDIDFQLYTDVVRLSNNGSPVVVPKVFDENDMSRLLPAILFKGYNRYVNSSKQAIANRYDKKSVEDIRVGFPKISSDSALILSNTAKLKNYMYNNTADTYDLLDYCLYSYEGVRTRLNIEEILGEHITKEKARKYLNGINCFGLYNTHTKGQLVINEEVLSKF